jgi:hypothetical protein
MSHQEYEYFCDQSYYHWWAVRPKGEKRWGRCYHVPSEEEAKALAEHLSQCQPDASTKKGTQ